MSKEVLRVGCPYKNNQCQAINCDKCSKYEAYRLSSNNQAVEKVLEEMKLSKEDDLLHLMFGLQNVLIKDYHSTTNLKEEDINYWINKYIIYIEESVYSAISFLKYDKFNPINTKSFQMQIIQMLRFAVNMFIVGKANVHNLEGIYLSMYNDNIMSVRDILQFIYDSIEIKEECMYTNDDIINEINNHKNDLFTSKDIQYIFDKDEVEKITNKLNITKTNINMLILLSRVLDSCSKVRNQIKWDIFSYDFENKTIEYVELHKCFVNLLSNIIYVAKSIHYSIDDIKNKYIQKSLEEYFNRQNK